MQLQSRQCQTHIPAGAHWRFTLLLPSLPMLEVTSRIASRRPSAPGDIWQFVPLVATQQSEAHHEILSVAFRAAKQATTVMLSCALYMHHGRWTRGTAGKQRASLHTACTFTCYLHTIRVMTICNLQHMYCFGEFN